MSYVDSMKNKVKRALMIPEMETFADDEITMHINSCIHLVEASSGMSEANLAGNGLVDALVLIYTKTFFGFKNDGSVKELPQSFDMLLRQLCLTLKE